MPRIKQTKIYNWETARVIADMLVESTGTHFLDSGGSSGRMWQRNRATVAKHGHGPIATFEDMPQSTFGWPAVHPHESHRDPEFKVMGNDGGTQAELWVSHHIYHWLKEAVSYAPEVDKALDELAAQMDEGRDEYDKPSWFEIYREFPEWYCKRIAIREAGEMDDEDRDGKTPEEYVEANGYISPTGMFGDGNGYQEIYTYNDDNCLSQDIHFIYFEHESFSGSYGEDGIALIMIHNGADARGGFTRPRAFWGGMEGDSPTLFDYHRFGIGCTNCSAIWDSEGGGEWNGMDHSEHKVLDIGEYNAREGDIIDASFLNAMTGVLVGDERPWIVIDEGDAQYPSDPGVKVHCPHCGTGQLQPWYY